MIAGIEGLKSVARCPHGDWYPIEEMTPYETWNESHERVRKYLCPEEARRLAYLGWITRNLGK
jgi:hypothetical protein